MDIENIYNMYHYFPSSAFMAQRLVGPSKQLKQIIQIEHMAVARPAVYQYFFHSTWLQKLLFSSFERIKTPV